jgi:subtilase family serine protease
VGFWVPCYDLKDLPGSTLKKGEIVIRKSSVSLLTLAAVLSTVIVVSQAQSQTLMTRHVREAVRTGEAKLVGHLPATQTMRFDVVLALRHQPELQDFLRDLYDPSSSSYKHYVTVPEFTERFGPSQEDYDALISFAKNAGFTLVGGSRDSMDVQFKAPVATVEKAFHVSMNVYQHPTENRTFFAPDREPTVNLSFPLWHVSGLDNYSIPRPAFVHKAKSEVEGVVPPASIGSCPQASFCGSDMRAAYYGGTALTGSGQNIGLLEYAGYDIADVNTYYTNAKQTRSFTVTGISTDGTSVNCTEPSCDDTEQTLDITQAGGMAPGVSTIFMYVGSTDTALLGSMSTRTPLPLNLSASWLWDPSDPSTDDPYFEKMATQGQSYFNAAGDDRKFNAGYPTWPADSAYIISVGGTDLTTKSAGGAWATETAWSDSGGGFWAPDDILIPAWQQLSGVINSKNEGSTTYRNAPDVSANANFTFYVCADQTTCTANDYGGTSFASPMWAGYLALANQQAASVGAPAPGFINPAIYAIGVGSNYDTDFHDITSGSNGYPAVTGYDLVTGWGSPNGSALINALVGSGGGGPAVTLAPTSLKWSKIVVGVTASGKKVTLTNSGTGTLNISTVAISGDFALATVKQTKTVTPCSNGLAVPAGGTCVIKVTFTPTQTGVRTGDVTFTDNAGNSPQQVPLTGTGEN